MNSALLGPMALDWSMVRSTILMSMWVVKLGLDQIPLASDAGIQHEKGRSVVRV